MGLFKNLFRKKELTQQEKENRSKAEREWAEKCYRSGENFAKKIALDKKIERINRYANTYPKTFFSVIGGTIVSCIILNFIFVGYNSVSNVPDTPTVPLPDNSSVNREVEEIIRQITDIEKQLNLYKSKDSLTHNDSVQVIELLLKMKTLNDML